MATSLTVDEVAQHTKKDDCWLIIADQVYNVTSFLDEHPGGEEVVLDQGGMDATSAFEEVGHSDEAREALELLRIGKLERKAGDPGRGAQRESQSSPELRPTRPRSLPVSTWLTPLLIIGFGIAMTVRPDKTFWALM